MRKPDLHKVGRVTTAEKITLGAAIAAALGVGALLKSWVDHLLARHEKKVTIADKSVQIAEALMTRMEAELTRAQAAVGKLERESEELRAERGLSTTITGEDSVRVINAKRKLRAAQAELAEARNNIHVIQIEAGKIRTGGLGRGLGALIPTSPPFSDGERELLLRLGEQARREAEGKREEAGNAEAETQR